MTYTIHVRDPKFGWKVHQQSSNIEEFNDEDRWYFNHILNNPTEGNYRKIGDVMYDVTNN